ncbi:Acyl-CoA synthetase X3 [Carabus blaptoides fortunei]
MKIESTICNDPDHNKRLCVPVTTEVNPGGLGVAFLKEMRKNVDKVAQIDAVTDKTQTYGEFLSHSIRIAQNLVIRGLEQGDIVCFCTLNNLDCYTAAIGGILAGGTFSALDPAFCVSDTRNFLKLLKPKYIFCDESGIKLIETAMQDSDIETEIIFFGETSKYIEFSEMLVSQADEDSFEAKKASSLDDTVAIFYSSGSTGISKGICTSHYSFLKTCMAQTTAVVFYGLTRLCWLTALGIVGISIMSGSSRVVSSDFNVQDIYRIIDKYQVSFMFASVLYGYQLTKYAEYKCDISHLKVFVMTGGRITGEQIMALRKLFPNTLVFQSYGITEGAGGVLAFTEADSKDIQSKPNSIGRAIEGCCAKVVDPDTEEIVDEPNKTGELRFKYDRMFIEYYKDAESTLKTFDSDGYFCTGDLVYYDEDYCFYFVDRIKDMMKFQSFYVSPLELEIILMSHPQIVEAVVISIPNDEDMDHPMGIVRLIAEATVTAEEIREFVDSKVVDYKRLRGGIKFYEVTCVITSAYYGYQITTQSEYIGDTWKLIGCLLIDGRVSAELIISLRKLLPDTVVLQSYGITETTGLVISYTEADVAYIQAKPGSMGHILEGICSKIVDLKTEKVVDGPRKTEEFRVKLDRMFNEYYKNPVATADVFDSEGYFCTGDIVYYDEDYYLYFVDRIKDMMKFRSFSIITDVLNCETVF